MINQLLDEIRDLFRKPLWHLAVWLDRVSRGRIHPNMVTIVGCAMHIPIALLIATGDYNVLAAGLLIIFGLFDTLDGQLARAQKRSSSRGMLLDASTDRMKEVLLYSGAAYVLAMSGNPALAVWAVVACGASLCVSYIKAKGEGAVASAGIDHAILNKLFRDGLLTFEIRMTLLIAGLLFNQLAIAIIVIAILSTYTAFQRLVMISRALSKH